MVTSMTGYGSYNLSKGDVFIEIEIKSVNSKFFDFNYRSNYNDKSLENQIRNYCKLHLNRGKIDIKIDINNLNTNNSNQLNRDKIKSYFNEIKSILSDTSKVKDKIILKNILNNLSLFNSENKFKVESNVVIKGLKKCIKKCIVFREEEGKAINIDLNKNINSILSDLHKIEKIDSSKKNSIEKKIKSKLSKIQEKSFDKFRIEQEILFYIEKLDINEEITRLKKHVNLFTNTLKTKSPNGKKLNFISQEIGREINTIGSKCSNFKIQKLVIDMKEKLEMIKEENYNIL
tara:strand:- start:25016 stop:25882 length:867 start_codon:yes stop_codon:yes gene_type:complete